MFNYIKKLFRRRKMTNNVEMKELDLIIKNYLNSDTLRMMNTGAGYYEGDHDILRRVRKAVGKDGVLVPVKNIPNNKIVDNMFANAVDQKTNYMLSKEITLVCEDKDYLKKLNKVFNNKFSKVLYEVGKDCYKFGISYLYTYYDKGELTFKKLDAREVIPVWKDGEHTELDYVIRLYKSNVFTKGRFEEVTNVEIYTLEGIDYYIWDNGLVPDGKRPHASYIRVGDQEYNWEKLPVIPFRPNSEEIPLIKRVKTIQDAINEIESDFKNDMEQNSRNTVLVIKNYDGDGGTLRHNLNLYGYIPVNSDGGVDALTIQVTAENYEGILRILKKSFIENAKCFDGKNEKMFGNVNQMNIKSMYSDIDLDASALEREFKDSFENLLWFANQFLESKETESVKIVFNKDILMNEGETIENCQKSQGVISTKTIMSHHPWVSDVELELKQIEEERQENLSQIEGGAYQRDNNQPRDVDE